MAHRSADERAAQKPSTAVWAIAVLSLLVWLPILPWTQAEQENRWTAERFLQSKDFEGFANFMNSVPESRFPAHWDSPPRIGYGEESPPVEEVFLSLLQNRSPNWIVNRYADKVESTHLLNFWKSRGVELLTDTQLEAIAGVIERSNEPSSIADRLVHSVEVELMRSPLSDSRTKSLRIIYNARSQ